MRGGQHLAPFMLSVALWEDPKQVELGGIEPPSAWRSRIAIRPSPDLWLTVATPPGGRTVESFLDRQGSFPPVSGLSRRPPLLLLPGCSGLAPRGLSARNVSDDYFVT